MSGVLAIQSVSYFTMGLFGVEEHSLSYQAEEHIMLALVVDRLSGSLNYGTGVPTMRGDRSKALFALTMAPLLARPGCLFSIHIAPTSNHGLKKSQQLRRLDL